MPIKLKIIPINKKFIILDETSRMIWTGEYWHFDGKKAKKFREKKDAFFETENIKFTEAKLYLQNKNKYEL